LTKKKIAQGLNLKIKKRLLASLKIGYSKRKRLSELRNNRMYTIARNRFNL
jgi:hypothetical protein